MNLKGIAPVFKTIRPSSKGGHQKFPYLLRNRSIKYVNEVWATDITYIKLCGRMVYFTTIIDLRSRKILSYRLSESMDVGFCMICDFVTPKIAFSLMTEYVCYI